MSEDWLEEALRNYQDAITGGTWKGIYRLEGKALESVMHDQAEACVHAFVELFGISPALDLDQFLEQMQMGGSSKVTIERDGDTILWREEHHGECMCPLVKREVVPLDKKLCVCAVSWLRMLVERHTERTVEVELLDSVAGGSQDCSFRITLGKAP